MRERDGDRVSTGRVRHGTLRRVGLAGCLALCPGAVFAESGTETGVTLIAGAGVSHASLAFTAPNALVSTRIDALPVLRLGVEAWPERALGLHAELDLGTGAQLGVPGTNARLAYNAHQLRAGGWYRWQPAPGGDGWDVRLGLGLQAVSQHVQAQNPALLVESQVAGPALESRVDKFFLSRRLHLGLGVGAALPFFVRETPRDSGDAGRFYAWGVGFDAGFALGPALALALDVRHIDQTVVFRGEGTRATGTSRGRTHDAFTTGVLSTRWHL
jgi:hypothetical protein